MQHRGGKRTNIASSKLKALAYRLGTRAFPPLCVLLQLPAYKPFVRSAFRSRSVPAASTNEAGTEHERQAVATQAAPGA